MVRLMICLSALLLGGGADLLSARGRELVAGSYNIRCDTPVDGDNAWPYRKERVEALIRFYGFDVLGVQEAKPSQMSDLRAMPGFASVGVGRDGGDRGEYSAIFYRTDRLRVLDSGTFWLSETPDTVSKGWDAALNRICTWAKMKDRRTGRVFYFFNTHFFKSKSSFVMSLCVTFVVDFADINKTYFDVFRFHACCFSCFCCFCCFSIFVCCFSAAATSCKSHHSSHD